MNVGNARNGPNSQARECEQRRRRRSQLFGECGNERRNDDEAEDDLETLHEVIPWASRVADEIADQTSRHASPNLAHPPATSPTIERGAREDPHEHPPLTLAVSIRRWGTATSRPVPKPAATS